MTYAQQMGITTECWTLDPNKAVSQWWWPSTSVSKVYPDDLPLSSAGYSELFCVAIWRVKSWKK